YGPSVPGLPTDYGSWIVLILPYIEQDNIAKQWPRQFYPGGIRDQNAFLSILQSPGAAGAQRIKVLECPSYAVSAWVYSPPNGSYFEAVTSYAACYGTMPYGTPPPPSPQIKDGMFHFNSSVRLSDVADGTSNTLLLGEHDARDPCIDDYQTASRGYWIT